jgi:prophage antirepressor-like protein
MPLYNTITFEKNKIFIISDNENTIWFNAKQVCLSLKYKEPTKAISTNVEKEDKIQLKYMDINFKVKQQPDSIYINESGLYSLLLSSRTQKAKKFNRWVRDKVLPLIRQNNIFSTDNDITKLQKKINELEKKNKILLNDMKVEKFPDGAMVYVVEEYDENNELYYKLGKTDDMNKRIKVYNTHSLHNKNVPYYVEVECPLPLENCIRSMLYKYRYKNRKDYFKCSLNKVKKAFTECVKSLNCVEEQEGGNIKYSSNNIYIYGKYKITYYDTKLKEIYDMINIISIN